MIAHHLHMDPGEDGINCLMEQNQAAMMQGVLDARPDAGCDPLPVT